MNKAIVLIDGENFRKKVGEVIKAEGINPSTVNPLDIKLKDLLSVMFKPYRNIKLSQINYYSAKLKVYPGTKKKSHQLIADQRHLKSTLESQGINFVIAGNVRAQEEIDSKGKFKKVTFKEKGVDVRIAVDMVAIACDKKFETIILCSSDSDIQPAVAEAKARGSKIVYLGFSLNPNKGLMFTTDQSVLFRNPEIISAVK
ncbi:MAG: NYN domain-containing protein [Candidatus Dojkabacteria bacterium]